jgi:hypothetical protein
VHTDDEEAGRELPLEGPVWVRGQPDEALRSVLGVLTASCAASLPAPSCTQLFSDGASFPILPPPGTLAGCVCVALRLAPFRSICSCGLFL